MEKFYSIVKKCDDYCLKSEQVETLAGFYYDGVAHGEKFQCLRIFLPFPYDCKFLEALKRFKRVHYETRISADGLIIMVYCLSDFERIEQLNRKAEIFLDAFWKERHENPQASQNALISAGNNALLSAGYSL